MTARAQPRTMPAMTIETIHPAVRVGHVHLRVSDLDRAIAFYRDVLGFEVPLDLRDVGIPAVFLAAGDYHHHVALNTFESEGGTPAPAGHTGLFHVAIRYPTRVALADALRRLVDSRIPLTGASDHGVSIALYLKDPDGNGIELYWDRPEEEWPRPPDGHGVAMFTEPVDVQALLAQAPEPVSGT